MHQVGAARQGEKAGGGWGQHTMQDSAMVVNQQATGAADASCCELQLSPA